MVPTLASPKQQLVLVMVIVVTGLASCERQAPASAPPDTGDVLARVGSLTIHERDLEHRIQVHYSGRVDEQTRQVALDDLVRRAQFAQAALDAGLADDTVIREEVGRVLERRLRERDLAPRIRQQMDIPEKRLREIYQSEIARFVSAEKRHVAVLWLDSGGNPDKGERHAEKMQNARAFVLQSRDLISHPEKGFAMLGADYSEHAASRHRGGVVGWLEHESGADSWTRAVAEIAFSIEKTGDLSEVTIRPEGVFLVRLMEVRRAVTRPFEAVAGELDREERSRRRSELEGEFERQIESRYPVEWRR
jgi:hypothetical protein